MFKKIILMCEAQPETALPSIFDNSNARFLKYKGRIRLDTAHKPPPIALDPSPNVTAHLPIPTIPLPHKLITETLLSLLN
jgi:hypothetical protein